MAYGVQTAKLFQNGSSQAVRLPKAFRFANAKEVVIEKEGDVVLLRPLGKPPIEQAIAALAKFEDLPARSQPKRPDRRLKL